MNKNMLRELSDRLPDVTDDMWQKVDKHHRDMVDEFLNSNAQLSPQSRGQYRSALRQWFYFVYSHLDNKPLFKISKRDFLKYMSYLQSRNMSSATLAFKKAAVSTMNNFIENVICEDDDRYTRFRNFTKNLPQLAKNQVYNKVKISKKEYEFMRDKLLEAEDYLGVAWLATSFNAGCRRGETPQFKTEIINYSIPDGQTYIMSHPIRLKGKGVDGRVEEYMINAEALKYMKLWVEKRGYEHEYIFTVKHGGNIKRMSPSWANNFCSNVLAPMLGRRVNPHLFKSSCITYLLESGVDIALVSRFVAHHADISTTIKFYDLRDFAEQKAKIFAANEQTPQEA